MKLQHTSGAVVEVGQVGEGIGCYVDAHSTYSKKDWQRVPEERRCGTCAHWKKIPNCATDNMGSCVFPLPFFVPMLNTWEMSGKDCPTWHAR